MALGNQADFDMHSGDNRVLQVTVRDDADVPVDITGATFKWQLSKLDASGAIPLPKSETPILQKDNGGAGGVAIISAGLGRADVTLLPADTAALRGSYYHELQMVLGGLTSTVLFGTVTIYRDLIQ